MTDRILYEDNHLLIVNKQPGEIVQGDKTGDEPMVEDLKSYIKAKYNKPGDVFLGVVHRLDRPVSGAVIFARTSKALERMNAMLQKREVRKVYWAIVSGQRSAVGGQRLKNSRPQNRSSEIHSGQNSDYELPTADCRPPTADCRPPTADCRPPTADRRPPTADCRPPTADRRPPTADWTLLTHYLKKNEQQNKSYVYVLPGEGRLKAELKYRKIASGERYDLLEVELLTGRHHQIRAQLAEIGCPIKGDLKYGFPRSNPDGSISLHARLVEFVHPVSKEMIHIMADPPKDALWDYFSDIVSNSDS